MSTYTISSENERDSFDVMIVGNDGARQTMLGFETKAAAKEWIVEDERRSNAEEVQSNFLMQRRFQDDGGTGVLTRTAGNRRR